MSQELPQVRIQKPPSFLGATLWIMAGIIFEGAGLGIELIKPPSYYPGVLWRTIGLVYMVLGGITLGLAYRRMKRFMSQFNETESGDAKEAEHFTETLAEKRP